MNPLILLELVGKWRELSVEPQCCDGSPVAEIPNAVASGRRIGLREAADNLETLVGILSRQGSPDSNAKVEF